MHSTFDARVKGTHSIVYFCAAFNIFESDLKYKL